jgi:hypothetical protein
VLESDAINTDKLTRKLPGHRKMNYNHMSILKKHNIERQLRIIGIPNSMDVVVQHFSPGP